MTGGCPRCAKGGTGGGGTGVSPVAASENARVHVLLLAGGLGTRLRPLTDDTPKCLIPIAGRPLLHSWLDLFRAAGIRRVTINTHHLPEQVRAAIAAINTGNGDAAPIHIAEFHEPALLGSAGTIAANPHLADDASDILIVYADNLSNVDLSALLRFHRSHGDPLTMMLFRTPHPERCGIAELDPEGRIISFEEKPRRPKSNLANAGVYALTPAAYREIAAMNAFDIGFDVLPRFTGRMRGWEWPGYHVDIGTHETLRQAEEDIAAGRLKGSHHSESGANQGANQGVRA